MDIPTHEELVERYEAFCRRHDMAETRFGRDATGEAQLIASIRSGRSPSLKTLQRVESFMADHDEKLRSAGTNPSAGNGDEVSGASAVESEAA